MPHPKYGKTAALFNSGGCVEGPPQALQIKMLKEAGIAFDYIIGNSVGAWHALHGDNPWSLWKNHITSPRAIYDLNPEIKVLVRSVLKDIPHEPLKHPIQFAKFVLMAFKNRPRIEWETDPSPQSLAPLIEALLKFAKVYGVDNTENFSLFTTDPLIKMLKQHLDLRNFFSQSAKVHILTRSVETGEEHIFSNKAEDKTRGANFHYLNSAEDAFLAAQAATALRLLFPFVKVNGGLYCDGGDSNPLPIDYIFEEGCDTIFVFTRDYTYARGKDPLHIHFETSDGSLIRFFHRLKREAEIKARKEGHKLFFVTPQYPLHPDYWLLGVSEAALLHTEKVETEAMQKWIEQNLNI